MQIVQTTFQVFHSFELAHQLLRRNHLRRIYSTWPWARLKREGIPQNLVRTFPLIHTADYFLSRSSLYPKPVADFVKANVATTFDHYTSRVIPPCDALIALSGAGLLTGPVVQRRGGKFICDRGSTHHRFQEDTLRDEYARWDLPHRDEAPGVVERDEAIYAIADAITVPSSVARRTFLKHGVPAEKVKVIPYGVRLDSFKKSADTPTGTFEVLFAGQVSVRKGIPYLLEAFARLQHPNKRLTVVGAVQDHMNALLTRLPTENVTFLGSIPQPELAARMSRSHVMVLASVEEGLALVQAQAMACECPVIATEATGAEDLFTDGVEGFIVPDRDVAALADPHAAPRRRPHRSATPWPPPPSPRVQTLGGWDRYGQQWDHHLHTLTGIPPDSTEL